MFPDLAAEPVAGYMDPGHSRFERLVIYIRPSFVSAPCSEHIMVNVATVRYDTDWSVEFREKHIYFDFDNECKK